MSDDLKEQKDKILQLVKDAIAKDKDLRDKFAVGDKFRFIRDHLGSLLERVEEGLSAIAVEEEKKSDVLAEDEVQVYVYIFNAQGLMLTTWKKMVNASVFYEYSVNRPIYTDKTHVEANIRTKANRVQHAYLTVAIKKADLLAGETRDSVGNPVFKVREGSLRFERLLGFTHNGLDYTLSPEGDFILKQTTES